MRIRRRPQQPSLHQASSDPAPSASSPSPTPQNAARNRGCIDGDDDEGRPDLGGKKSGVARRLTLPQDNAAVDSGMSAGAGAGREAGDVVHVRCQSTVDNGHDNWDQKDSVTCTAGAVGSKPEPPAAAKAEEHASNGALRPVAPPVVAVKDEEKVISNGSVVGGGATKKRRGPAVLLEGSRCSRVNGRGWRCSQPTLVGYSLCEHHLGKGRARSSSGAGAGGGARGGPGQLGRTEHRARVLPASSSAAAAGAVTIAAVGAVTIAAVGAVTVSPAAPNADVRPAGC